MSVLSRSAEPSLSRLLVCFFTGMVFVFGLLASADGQQEFVRGDVMDDGDVDVFDAIRLRSILGGIDYPLGCEKAADVQDDGDHDIFDAIYILNWLGGLEPAPSCIKTTDVQDDGDADLFDAIYILNWLGGYEPPPSAPCCGIPDDCGTDPTPDELSCDSYPICE